MHIDLNNTPKVVWITGLSGAGKSTLAHEITRRIRINLKLPVIMLDGDDLRLVFSKQKNTADNYSRDGRLKLAMQYAKLCQLISNQNITVVIATISMYREIYEWNRLNLSGYFEIYIKVPEKELRRRDPKGIYKNYDEGKISHVAGLDLKVDEPRTSDWIINYKDQTTEELTDKFFEKINKLEIL